RRSNPQRRPARDTVKAEARSDPRYVTRERQARRYTRANPQPVGRPASENRADAMFELTFKLKLSYKQLHGIIALLMLIFS
ncbi:hypothetical protein, partial [Burkholderia gladioli]|uniref:hypothetical protein n=1 Tax=Burkholderia gladioli TaxID=28095 RepID=UPI001ABB2910